MNDVCLSIIIPVYNVEIYLKRCLDSLCSRLRDDIEIILVDDGSTDSSGQICDEYSKLYDNIVVIHSVNSGAGEARNTGLDKANGKKIWFVDADDKVSLNCIEQLDKIASKADLIAFSSSTFNDKGDVIEKYILKNRLFDVQDALLPMSKSGQFPFLWNKIFDKAILDADPKTRFIEKRGPGEDEIFICSYWSKIKTVYTSDACIYNYYRQDDPEASLSHRFCPDLYDKTKKLIDARMQMYSTLGSDNEELLKVICDGNVYSIYKCIPNMYRKGKIVNRKHRISFYKDILKMESLNAWIYMNDSNEKVLKLFKKLYKTKTCWMIDSVYYVLFWIRYNIVLNNK